MGMPPFDDQGDAWDDGFKEGKLESLKEIEKLKQQRDELLAILKITIKELECGNDRSIKKPLREAIAKIEEQDLSKTK